MADVDLSVVPYGNNVDNCEPQPPVRYKECMRNHAAAIGGHANDGCGEFMPSATVSGSSLSCAACGCHRNFHRREVHHHNHHRQLVLLASPPHATPQHTPRVVSPYNVGPKWVGLDSNLHLARVDGEDNVDGDGEDYDRRSETPEREVVDPVVSPAASAEGRSGGKRFRTKFTAEQKERMVEFAERLGWRVQCQDDGEINRFCNEIGVKRQVLKVWMHNNKNNQRRKMETQPSSAVDTAPPPPLQHAGI